MVGASSPECGLDSGDGYGVYITGGVILAAGGNNSAPTNSSSTQAYVVMSQSVTAGATVTVSDGSTTLVSFEIPASYSSATETRGPGGGGWNWGGGPGGSQGGGSLLISCPAMVSGKSYTITVGTTSTTSTARTTGGSTGM